MLPGHVARDKSDKSDRGEPERTSPVPPAEPDIATHQQPRSDRQNHKKHYNYLERYVGQDGRYVGLWLAPWPENPKEYGTSLPAGGFDLQRVLRCIIG